MYVKLRRWADREGGVRERERGRGRGRRRGLSWRTGGEKTRGWLLRARGENCTVSGIWDMGRREGSGESFVREFNVGCLLRHGMR